MIISFLFAGNLLSAQQTLQEDQSPGTGVTAEDYKICTDKCSDTYPNDEVKRNTCIEGCRYISRAIPKADIEAPKPLNTAPAQPPKTTTPTTTTPTKTTTKKQ